MCYGLKGQNLISRLIILPKLKYTCSDLVEKNWQEGIIFSLLYVGALKVCAETTELDRFKSKLNSPCNQGLTALSMLLFNSTFFHSTIEEKKERKKQQKLIATESDKSHHKGRIKRISMSTCQAKKKKEYQCPEITPSLTDRHNLSLSLKSHLVFFG